MQRTKLNVTSINVGDRQRTDYGDVTALAQSLSRFGLIQPIVLAHDNRLIAGGRRLAAAKSLGWLEVDVVYRETLNEAELLELELEENIQRKSMHWTEECLGIARIHVVRVRQGITDGASWTQQRSAEMFGISVGALNYILRVASELRKEQSLPPEKRRCHNCDSASDAYRNVILRDEQERVMSELNRRMQSAPGAKSLADVVKAERAIAQVTAAEANPDYLREERRRYESNPLNTVPFDAYWEEKTRLAQEARDTICISNRFFHGDCITFMHDPANASRFDHIITDIPYGIDMENVAQDNVGMSDHTVDLIRAEHDVEDNINLFRQFFPAAFACTKPTAYVLTFCDYEHLALMSSLAHEAGFVVQRWPFVWIKTNSCQNSAAQYNFTKTHEPVLVCRKPGAVLAHNAPTGSLAASNSQAVKETGHPFAKPYEIITHLAQAVSLENQLILDPFCGRGSIVIELLRNRRHAYGCELNPAHFNALMENVKSYYLGGNPRANFV